MHLSTRRASPAVNEWTHRILFLAITVSDRLGRTEIRSKVPEGPESLLTYPHVWEVLYFRQGGFLGSAHGHEVLVIK
jgi:hypothetical protein